MYTNKNTPFYLTAVILFIVLKFCFTLTTNNDLAFLLTTTDKCLGVLTGFHSLLTSDGYYYEQLNILLDKSCSGFNFWILSFLVFSYLTLKSVDKTVHKILMIPATLLGAYLLTIFVNTSRIFASIIVQNQTKNFLATQQHLVHEAVGVVTNLSFLILAYCLIEKMTIKAQHDAQPA